MLRIHEPPLQVLASTDCSQWLNRCKLTESSYETLLSGKKEIFFRRIILKEHYKIEKNFSDAASGSMCKILRIKLHT